MFKTSPFFSSAYRPLIFLLGLVSLFFWQVQAVSAGAVTMLQGTATTITAGGLVNTVPTTISADNLLFTFVTSQVGDTPLNTLQVSPVNFVLSHTGTQLSLTYNGVIASSRANGNALLLYADSAFNATYQMSNLTISSTAGSLALPQLLATNGSLSSGLLIVGSDLLSDWKLTGQISADGNYFFGGVGTGRFLYDNLPVTATAEVAPFILLATGLFFICRRWFYRQAKKLKGFLQLRKT